MNADILLDEMVERVKDVLSPDKIVLFGSRSRGDAGQKSDYDLLVVTESSQPRHRRSASAYTAIADLPVEVDIIVYTPSEVEEWRDVPEAFVSTALREGIVLYERQV